MRNIQQKINQKDSWYIDSQLDKLHEKAYLRTVGRRWQYIQKALDTYRQAHTTDAISVLDAGCGDGLIEKYLKESADINIVAVDYNPVRVKRIAEEFENIKVIEADLVSLDLHREFDIIICSQVLEHIDEDDRVLKNLHRHLKTAGILILGVPNEGCFLAQIRNRFLQPQIGRTTDHVNFYTENVIRGKIESAGFRVRSVMYENFFFPHMRINKFFASFGVGFKIMNFLGVLCKSQVAGYFFVVEKL